ncbi:gephyrin-like molybdotransferase Glp [Bosea sp. (in: a-proteobacteria)]|uniref:molybdopterin molybdotransferase MoeA n=1 Tax=Bosea sp. (in: a-proteobacteria) TaxID=1871050 RepID=UPI0026074A6B|nr:gephyrin-like molybdotransferase Glp [Bosea sp. (in: a-proteobacteria)]MCO5089391.1 molybdopterin molybdotransferase MoeA [Bosea sp. (in: a-proteobacteria)]
MTRLGGGRHGSGLVTLDEAAARAVARAVPLPGTAALPLAEADGHVLAQAVIAPRDLPPFANAAVDGYAVRFADLAAGAETCLPVLGRTFAGEAPAMLAHGAWRIFTGAAVPDGADTVVMQEDVAAADGAVVLPAGIRRGAHLRLAGEDVACGQEVLPAGRRLRPQDLGLVAALGLARVTVRARPRVALFSTGDELVEPGRPLPPAAIYDANRVMLRAMLRRAGADVADLGILRDGAAGLERRLREAAAVSDLVLTSGGVSVGEADHVRDAVLASGRLDLWQVAIKPGKPIALGSVAGTPFLGLPGNPVAVFVGFAFLARPLLARMAGEAYLPPPARPVRLGFAHGKKPGRREFLRVSLEPSGDGWVARRHPGEGAGSLASLAQSDGLIVLAEDVVAVEAGDEAPFLPYAELF